MGEARAEIVIDRSADDVWAVVGDFGTLDWMPGVTSCELDGDQRVLEIGPMSVVEELRRRDDATRTLVYGLVGGSMTPRHHEGTITVDPQGDSSHVTWDVDTDDELVEVMRDAYEGALQGLKARLEG